MSLVNFSRTKFLRQDRVGLYASLTRLRSSNKYFHHPLSASFSRYLKLCIFILHKLFYFIVSSVFQSKFNIRKLNTFGDISLSNSFPVSLILDYLSILHDIVFCFSWNMSFYCRFLSSTTLNFSFFFFF